MLEPSLSGIEFDVPLLEHGQIPIKQVALGMATILDAERGDEEIRKIMRPEAVHCRLPVEKTRRPIRRREGVADMAVAVDEAMRAFDVGTKRAQDGITELLEFAKRWRHEFAARQADASIPGFAGRTGVSQAYRDSRQGIALRSLPF